MSGSRHSGGGGCGCAAVLAVLVVVLAVIAVNIAPPVVRNVVEAYRQRLLGLVGMREPVNVDKEGLGFSGEQLSESEQQVYLQLLDQARERKDSFVVFEALVDEIDPAYKALMCDHPELFWLDGSCTYVYSNMGNVVTVEPGLSVPLEEVPALQARAEAVADEFLASLPEDADDYDVIREAYRYVILSTEYDLNADQSQNILSVLLNHSSVCAGYARAYQYLLHRAGVFCAYVEGVITETSEDHAWNLVRVGDVYAYVDPTWGDPTYQGSDDRVSDNGVIYDYLGLTTEEMLRDQHVFSSDFELPDCTSHDLDYYHREGMTFDSYDPAALSESFRAQLGHGNMAAFKFTNKQAFDEASNALYNSTFLTDDLLAIAVDRGETTLRYSYVLSDTLYVVKVYW